MKNNNAVILVAAKKLIILHAQIEIRFIIQHIDIE